MTKTSLVVARPARARELDDRLERQIRYTNANVAFFRERPLPVLADATLDERFASLPVLAKDALRRIDPLALIADALRERPGDIYLHRGTGGTTGAPISVFYSEDDWRAHVEIKRAALVARLARVNRPIIAFNNYNQGHISGPGFGDVVRASGGFVINRGYGADDERAYEELVHHRCNVIVAPPISTTKGGSFADLLECDARRGGGYLNGTNVDCVLFSSTGLTADLIEELEELRIPAILNLYGSTEVGTVGVSCPRDPRVLHLVEGHVVASVLGPDGMPVASGARGMLVVGRLAGLGSAGDVRPATSTSFLKFAPGDEVTFFDERCACGDHVRHVRDVARVADVEEKVKNGCQVWS